MIVDPETISPNRMYATMIRAITPRPIAWISTISARGATNLAPFSYFNGVCSKPAALSVSFVNKPDGSEKDTLRNIRATMQFVVNVVPYRLAEPMARTSLDFEYGDSEFDKMGIRPVDSQRVRPPGVADSPIRFECETMQIVPVGEGPFGTNLVIGRILLLHIDDDALDADGKIDPAKVDTIGRMGGRTYCRTTERFEIDVS